MNRAALAEPVRRSLKRLPPPFEAHYGIVPAPPPDTPVPLGQAVHLLDAATRAMARADTLAEALPGHFLLSRILVRQEALSSSAIEDTHSTLDALLMVEETGDGSPPATALQVRDYAVALEAALLAVRDKLHDAFTLDLIAGLHRSVMAGDVAYADAPGELRRIVNWVGGGNIARSTFNPPPPDDVPRCLEHQIAYLRCLGQQALTQHVVTRMAVAHAHFEVIHPYRDGNGRVGRLLLPLMMAADGHTPLYLSPFIAMEKDRYYHALKAAQQRLDHEPLISLLAEAIVATVDDAEAAKRALDDLLSRWRQRRVFRANSAAQRALEMLPGYPIVEARRMSERLAVSFQAANRAIDQLVEAGILAPRGAGRRNRVFAATEVLAIYNRRFGEWGAGGA
jgi:Fic family protein